MQNQSVTNTYTMKTEEERNHVKEWIIAILTLMLIILFGLAVGRCKDNNTTWEYTDTTFRFQGYDRRNNYHRLDLHFSEISSVVISKMTFGRSAQRTGMELTQNNGKKLDIDLRKYPSYEYLTEHINSMYFLLTSPQNAPSVQDSLPHAITIHKDKSLLTIFVNKSKICATKDKKLTLNVKTGDIVSLIYGSKYEPRAYFFRFQDPSITHYYIDNLTIECMSEEE